MHLHSLLLAPGWLVLLAVFALPALEASTLVGVVIPGETAVLLGGVIAHDGRVSLAAVMAAAVLGAVAGDSLGFALGRRLGPSIARRLPVLKRARADASALVRRYGAAAVLVGRWVALVRAVIPAVAGGSGVPYRSFVLYNVGGGVLWGVTVCGAGYFLGTAYADAERSLGIGGAAVIVALVVLLGLTHLRRLRG